MKLRTFTVPFSKVVGDDATELEFGPDDYIVVRPLFGLPRDELTAWSTRIESVQQAAQEASLLPHGDPGRVAAEDAADLLVLDTIRAACIEWHLTGFDGEAIPMPGTTEALDALPGGLVARLYPFLSSFRGAEANPTTRS